MLNGELGRRGKLRSKRLGKSIRKQYWSILDDCINLKIFSQSTFNPPFKFKAMNCCYTSQTCKHKVIPQIKQTIRVNPGKKSHLASHFFLVKSLNIDEHDASITTCVTEDFRNAHIRRYMDASSPQCLLLRGTCMVAEWVNDNHVCMATPIMCVRHVRVLPRILFSI